MGEKHNKTLLFTSEESFELSLHEVCVSVGVSIETIQEMIDEGILVFDKIPENEWRFDHDALRKIRKVLQLNHDLGVNFAGAALALDLLTEIEHLHSLLRQKK